MLGRIRNAIKEKLNIFKKSNLYSYLKKVKTLRRIREKYGRLIGNWMLYKFRLHGDFIHLNVLKKIIKEHNITSIVETGTYLGYTTMLLAKTFPNLEIYTCEINNEFYLKAKENTKSLKNIHLFNSTSPEFIKSLIKNPRNSTHQLDWAQPALVAEYPDHGSSLIYLSSVCILRQKVSHSPSCLDSLSKRKQYATPIFGSPVIRGKQSYLLYQCILSVLDNRRYETYWLGCCLLLA